MNPFYVSSFYNCRNISNFQRYRLLRLCFKKQQNVRLNRYGTYDIRLVSIVYYYQENPEKWSRPNE